MTPGDLREHFRDWPPCAGARGLDGIAVVIDWSEGLHSVGSILGPCSYWQSPRAQLFSRVGMTDAFLGPPRFWRELGRTRPAESCRSRQGWLLLESVVNFAFGRPAIRLIGSAAAFLRFPLSGVWSFR